MQNKVALVVGGNGGIGSGVVAQLIRDEFEVYATFFNSRTELDMITDRNELHPVQCDVTNQSAVEDVVNSIQESENSIDVIVFTVTAPLKNARAMDLEWSDFDLHLNMQIKPLLFAVHALREQIRLSWKTKFIILLTEYCIGNPPKGLSHYVTAKYAAMGMAKALAMELAEFKCTVNMISPGMVETPLLDDIPPKLIEITAYNNPLKRNATSDDIASAISFLASDRSDFINGANIVINGGGVLT